MPIRGWILPMLILSSLPALQGQNFQRQFGTSFDNVFTRVFQDGTHYYVLGQDQPTSGATPHATVTRLDANGLQLWTLTLDMPSVWNDAVLTPTGDLLVVGNTLPAVATNQSLMGLVTSSSGGQFTWVRSYDVPGREANIKIIKNPAPQNASFPYYVVGGQFDPSGSNALWDDIFLLNINAAGNFNWKKKFPSTADDEFGRDLEVLPNGNMLLSGNLGSAGVIVEVTNAGAIVSGATPTGLSFTYADVVQSSGGGYYAVGNTFPSITNYLMKYDQNLIGQWEANISSLSTVRSVWEDSSTGDLFVTGDWNVGGATRTVVLNIKVIANAPVLQWVRYLDNGEFSYATGYTSLLPSGVLAYADGRVPSINGFGSVDAFISISDLDINTCMTEEDFININPVVFTYDAPNVLDMEFFDFSTGTDLNSTAINYQQETVCSEPCQADFIITHIGDCGHYQVTNTSTGVAPLTYQWCDGQTTEHLDVMLPCGPHTFCLTITDATGCTSSYQETITVSDTRPPVARCEPSFGVVLNANCEYIVTPQMIDGGSTDNCQIQSLSVSPSVLSGCGLFPVTLTVTDWCGNTDTCTTMIETIEDIPPTIVCPMNVTVMSSDHSPCSSLVNGLSFISATDNCGTPFVTYVVTGATNNFGQNDASGLTYNEGVSTVTYTATDDCGNTSSCSFNVTVLCAGPCDSISIILNTGWDNQTSSIIPLGNPDQDGAPDLDWIVTADPLTPPPPGGRPANVTGMYSGGWTFPFTNSEWISCSPTWYENQLPNPPYLFTNEIKFNLPAGYTNPSIALQMRADELIHNVYLNNNLIYQYFPPHVDGGFSGPPLIVNNNTAAFFQTSQNTLTVNYSDESGGVAGFNLAGSVTFCKDTCVCGTFSDMAIRFERGPGVPVACGGAPVTLSCPPAGYTYTLSGQFMCEGNACDEEAPFEAQLEQPNGTILQLGSQSANPYFGVPLPNQLLQEFGVYTLTLKGHCGSSICTCVIKFIMDPPCGPVCPCTPQDIGNFLNNAYQGASQLVFSDSCTACFTPIALTGCEQVNYWLDSIANGQLMGQSIPGQQTFCYTFPGPGTYTVIMVISRYDDNGMHCGTTYVNQTVTLLCERAPGCDESRIENPSFGDGATAGGMLSGGASAGWFAPSGQPEVIEGAEGSDDGWSMVLSGNLDTADVLALLDPICLRRMEGMIRVGIAVNDSAPGGIWAGRPMKPKPCDKVMMILYKGDFDPATRCGSGGCYHLASFPLSELRYNDWNEWEVPYNLRSWITEDDCGDSSVIVRPAIYVTNALSTEQGGLETYSLCQLDRVCLSENIVSTHDLAVSKEILISPNPNNGTFFVHLDQTDVQNISVRILNLTGQLIREEPLESGISSPEVRVEDLTNGLYFIQVLAKGQIIHYGRFVKQ